MSGGALDGVLVLDFSTLLPGPLATLMLARAGADVVKIERPDGEPGRADVAVFDILNRGKRSIAIDLKRDAARLQPLLARCDVLVEQFRPGVMERLGLGYDAVRAINPRVVYASINGYGSTGPDAPRPGHDLTYQAEAGILALNADAAGRPVLPATMAADIGGGTLPAVVNIALALFRRERTGEGARLDIAMFEGLLPFLCEPIAHAGEGRSATSGYSAATGGSPRYNLYRTADGRHLALASPEEKFWLAFCDRAELPDDADHAAVAARLLERPAAEWLAMFDGADMCCSLVASVEEAMTTPRFQRLMRHGSLPLPIASPLQRQDADDASPRSGEANETLLGRGA